MEKVACECPRCKDNLEFELPEHLIDEIQQENVVIFAGAGVSTENPNSTPHSLYTAMAVGCNLHGSKLAFPDLAQKYVDQPDGRFKLLKLIQEHFDYVYKFRDLRTNSTQFYRELSTMPYFRTFVTTNWDRNFEVECRAKPFCYDPDMRFWSVPHRRVLKIHGTIDDYSSIVATRDDYDECLKKLRTSLIGGKLKEILNNSTCIFIGYSMNDDDFREIYEFVKRSQGKFEKTHYFVNPNIGAEAPFPNIFPIKTDGTYFLSVIKEHMSANAYYLSDDIYDLVEEELDLVRDEHFALWEKYDPQEYPQIIQSTCYQDGLIHGYEFVLDMRCEGRHSDLHHLLSIMHGYETIIDGHLKSRRYHDVAYFRGYQNVALGMTLYKEFNEPRFAPRYYFQKLGEMDLEEFEETLHAQPEMHKSAYKACLRAVKKIADDDGFVLQHMPWG